MVLSIRRTPPTCGGDRDEDLAVDRVDRGEGVGVDEREVLGLDAEALHGGQRGGADGGGVALAGGDGVLARRAARALSASARARLPPRRTLRLDSARPSGSRTVGATSIADRDVEVADEPADDQRLLGVLLAEVGRRRARPC